MNIFFFDESITKSARAYPDKYYKIILEIAQMMSTAKKLEDPTYPCYKASHVNHPMTKWVRESIGNFFYAARYAYGIQEEMYYRFGTTHKSMKIIDDLCKNPPLLKTGFSQPPLCMPDEYKSDDIYRSYRLYFTYEKLNKIKCTWKNRNPPSWLQLK